MVVTATPIDTNGKPINPLVIINTRLVSHVFQIGNTAGIVCFMSGATVQVSWADYQRIFSVMIGMEKK